MKRAAIVALAAVMATVVVVAREDGENSAQAAVKQAAARTLDAGSMRFSMSMHVPELPAELARKFEGEGVIDYVNHRGRITSWGGTEMLSDGDVTYTKWPLPWRRETVWLRHETDAGNFDALDLEERALRNPIGLLDFLTGASSDVREAVRDTTTVHYEGTLDLQKVVDEAPPDKRAELQEWLDFIAEHVPTQVPFGLWVDNTGLAHRLRIDRIGASVTIDYYDFGVPVEITPPSASEIISFEELAAELEQHGETTHCEGSIGNGGTAGSGSSPTGERVEYCIVLTGENG